MTLRSAPLLDGRIGRSSHPAPLSCKVPASVNVWGAIGLSEALVRLALSYLPCQERPQQCQRKHEGDASCTKEPKSWVSTPRRGLQLSTREPHHHTAVLVWYKLVHCGRCPDGGHFGKITDTKFKSSSSQRMSSLSNFDTFDGDSHSPRRERKQTPPSPRHDQKMISSCAFCAVASYH